MKRYTLVLVVALAALFTVLPSRSASAQEILLEGPLAGAPAVRKMVQYRQLRFSVGPQFAYTLNNEYMHNFLLGLKLEFNFTDWLNFGLTGYFGINAPTSLTNHVKDSVNIGGSATTPSESNYPSYTGAAHFLDQVGRLRGIYTGQLGFTPFRGKMSMFEKVFVAIDGTIFIGGGIVHLDERKNCVYDENDTANAQSCGTIDDPAAGLSRVTRITGTFLWGVNFMAHFNNWFAVNIEYRMSPFKWNPGGTDEAGESAPFWERGDDGNWVKRHGTSEGDYPDGIIDEADRQWNLNQSIALGFIFYLPLTPSVTN
ncbi:MAG: hypothetical protein MUC50_12070 [Myxococcota bacterium]|jgi:hypothetical protein|nr:hypothetical protein [Myxococcota bacterium]